MLPLLRPSVLLHTFKAPPLGAYAFKVITSSWGMSPFVIVDFALITFQSLSCTLLTNNITHLSEEQFTLSHLFRGFCSWSSEFII